MKIKNKILIVFIATLAGTIIWIVSIFLAPYLRAQSVYWSRIIYVAFSPICHQIPARCFIFYGYPLAVCTRCLGIYFGFFVGTLFYPLFRGFASITLPEKNIYINVSSYCRRHNRKSICPLGDSSLDPLCDRISLGNHASLLFHHRDSRRSNISSK